MGCPMADHETTVAPGSAPAPGAAVQHPQTAQTAPGALVEARIPHVGDPGWAAAPVGLRAHYVAADAARDVHAGRPIGVAVCGATGYVDEDSLNEAQALLRCWQCERRLDLARVEW